MCVTLVACDAAAPSASADAGASTTVGSLCTSSAADGTLCSGDNGPGLTGESVNNQGLIGNSIKGRGVYGSSISSEGGYFSSTDGDGLLGYSTNGFSGHFTGGKGVVVDAPGVAGAPALSVAGSVEVTLGAAPAGSVVVCGTLDPTSGLFTLTKCEDRIAALEARIAALEGRVGAAP